MQIKHKDTTYTAEDNQEMMKVLREQARLSQEEIGKLLGFSRAYVSYVLKTKYNISGDRDYPELRNPGTFKDRTDEQIARDLGVTVYRVTEARKALDIKRNNIIKPHRRRRDLVKFLFGKKYNPGGNFEGWLSNILRTFNPRQIEIMQEFYIEGATESTHAKINSDTARVYRSVTRKELKQKVSELSIDNLIKIGVLKNGSHSKGN